MSPDALGGDVPTRLKANMYKLGDKKFFCKMEGDALKVRSGGAYITFAEFIRGLKPAAKAAEQDDSSALDGIDLGNAYANV